MKLFIGSLMSIVLSASLLANSTKQTQLASDMRSMLDAVSEIQRAGFYYSQEDMINGIKKLKSSLESLKSTDARSYLPHDKAYADKFAQKRARMIEMYADDMVESLQSGKVEDALEDYSQIITQCTSCHSRMRKNAWELK